MPHHLFHQPAVITVAVTVAAVAVSVAVTQATMWWVDYDAGLLPALLAAAIPAVMVPLTVYPLANSNQRLRQVQGELERIALTDVLTDLPNRRAFFESAERMLATPSTADHPVAALMIDVDHFKAINDNHGHGTGDDVLRALSAAIRDAVAEAMPTDWTVARLGGEEFAVLTAGLAPSEVARLAERICHTARELCHDLPAPAFATTVSVGVAVRQGDEDIDELLRAADDAVYIAKQSGRDRWAFSQTDRRATLAPALNAASAI
jgi:diguanylate cyclase (GGDEF)-like protein